MKSLFCVSVTALILCLILPCMVLAKAKKKAAYPPPPEVGQKISVEDTIYGVLRTHRNLRGMQENNEALKYELRRARAGFGPSIDLSGRAGGSIYSDSTSRSQKLDYQMWGLVGGSAKLVQPIWDGFATRSRVRNAQSTLDSHQFRTFDTATSLSLDGIIAHIDLLRRRTIYKMSEDNVAQHQSILLQVKERAELGVDTAADMTQAQSRLQRALSSLSENRDSLLVAEETYQRLTGLPAEKLAEVKMPPDVFEEREKIFQLAEQNNPKLKAYLQDIRIERANRELAEANMYPTLNIEAGPDYSNRGGGTDRWTASMDVLGTVRWNIFNSGADLAEYQAASARMRQARQILYDYLDELKLDIRSTWSNYQAAQEQYKHYTKAVEANTHTRDAYLEQFSIGNRSLLDLLDSINELYTSSTQAETARGNILVGAYRLSALTGQMLPSMSIDTRPLYEKPVVDKTDKRERFQRAWFK